VRSRALSIPGVWLLEPTVAIDARGCFSEIYIERELHEVGLTSRAVQENRSVSTERGVVRGLHFQVPPHAQDKLVRVAHGSIFDVAVDIRLGSPTFGKYIATLLSAQNQLQLWIPKGFAHGLCTLEPNTEVLYKVTAYYAAESERGIIWNDPDIAIDWPIAPEKAVLSPRDALLPRLAELPDCFRYDGTTNTRARMAQIG
jgi:dTDP-4-dehydrorhamnose 3,5-epimerase